MIRSFACKETEKLFQGTFSRRLPQQIHKRAYMRLRELNRACAVEEMGILPGNRLEKLAGDLKNHWSIRINDQFRIIFQWTGQDAEHVQIVDYH